MYAISKSQGIPIHRLEPDEETGNKYFRLYQYDGNFPNQSELLVPHRKDHYLIVFVRHADSRQWIDMMPVVLKDNTIYFSGPDNIIVKEEFKQLWSTGIAFTPEFLSFQENISLRNLPIIMNPQNGHELLLQAQDVQFIEDILSRISTEYHGTGEWQQRMLSAYLTLLLTHLSRLYAEQYRDGDISAEKMLLKNFQAKIDDNFYERHEVADYAALLNISAGHLSEVVKSQSGRSAIKHIHERIVLEARRLLFHTNNSLKEIAFDLGFADASYFNRFFKRETGVTPADYRAGFRKMYQ